MRHIIFLLTISLFIVSCGQNETKQKELELKERELALKEKEFAKKEKDTSYLNTQRPETNNKNNPQETKSTSSQITISPKSNYKLILKNVVSDDNGSKRADIYFNINGIEYLVQGDEWIRNWKEFQNKGNKLFGCSIGEKQTADGYNEYWIEKSGDFLLIKSSSVGGNAQIVYDELIKKIKL
ncbi:MAG: hypothetical protein IPP81_20030 [Chitinophagaceae bacterium]|nr:hypothetical protein [Chitinophagaceae bacterium]